MRELWNSNKPGLLPIMWMLSYDWYLKPF